MIKIEKPNLIIEKIWTGLKPRKHLGEIEIVDEWGTNHYDVMCDTHYFRLKKEFRKFEIVSMLDAENFDYIRELHHKQAKNLIGLSESKKYILFNKMEPVPDNFDETLYMERFSMSHNSFYTDSVKSLTKIKLLV